MPLATHSPQPSTLCSQVHSPFCMLPHQLMTLYCSIKRSAWLTRDNSFSHLDDPEQQQPTNMDASPHKVWHNHPRSPTPDLLCLAHLQQGAHSSLSMQALPRMQAFTPAPGRPSSGSMVRSPPRPESARLNRGIFSGHVSSQLSVRGGKLNQGEAVLVYRPNDPIVSFCLAIRLMQTQGQEP